MTTIGFFCRARAFFAAHGIWTGWSRTTGTTTGPWTSPPRWSRSGAGTTGSGPYTPRHNGKVERYNRLMVDEVLYARPYSSEQARREALQVWVNHYNYHRPHTSCGDAPPASLAPARVNNVMTSYT